MHRMLLALLLCCFWSSGYTGEQVPFSSDYTDLHKHCQWAYGKDELDDGQDNALRCKGYGNFEIFIYFSGSETLLTVQQKKNPTYSLPSSMVIANYQQGMVEWRMANGVPFAIIVRSKIPGDMNTQEKTETLEVRGLKKFESINFSVDVKAGAGANEKARMLADTAYLKVKK